jgi:hypothetical protein
VCQLELQVRQEAEAARQQLEEQQLEEQQQAAADPARTVAPPRAPSEVLAADAADALRHAAERHTALASRLEQALDDEARGGAEFTCFTSAKALALLVQKHKY